MSYFPLCFALNSMPKDAYWVTKIALAIFSNYHKMFCGYMGIMYGNFLGIEHLVYGKQATSDWHTVKGML